MNFDTTNPEYIKRGIIQLGESFDFQLGQTDAEKKSGSLVK
jgi:hypothetical protein